MIEAQLTKHFAGKAESAAFTLDVQLDAADGITVLFGPSGAGKTLTLDLIAGFLQPDAGRVVLDGEDITHQPARNRRAGYVFQNYALFPHMTLRQNLEFAAQQRPGGALIDQLLDRFRLAGVAGRKPGQLSGGQKQRGSIARALVGQPRVLLLDEPTRGLDTGLRHELYQTLKGIRTPILLVTHDLEECYALGEQVVVMLRGRVVQRGTPREIAERPAMVEVAELLGIYNILPGQRAIQYRHVAVEPDETGVAVKQIYQRAQGVLVEFENEVRAELAGFDSSVSRWRVDFPADKILTLRG